MQIEEEGRVRGVGARRQRDETEKRSVSRRKVGQGGWAGAGRKGGGRRVCGRYFKKNLFPQDFYMQMRHRRCSTGSPPAQLGSGSRRHRFAFRVLRFVLSSPLSLSLSLARSRSLARSLAQETQSGGNACGVSRFINDPQVSADGGGVRGGGPARASVTREERSLAGDEGWKGRTDGTGDGGTAVCSNYH
jgi:hypothetical protein